MAAAAWPWLLLVARVTGDVDAPSASKGKSRPREAKSSAESPSGAETNTAVFHAPAGSTFSDFAQLVNDYLTKEDLRAFKAATGTSVAHLLELVSEEVAQGRKCHAGWENRMAAVDLLTAIMGNDRLFLHPLNQYGLHPLRALLSERILDRARHRTRSSQHDLFERMRADGIVVVPLIDQLLNTSVQGLYSARDGYVARLFESVSGYRQACCGMGGDNKGRGATLKSPRGAVFSAVRAFVFHPNDIQIYMHVDAYNPTWKVWIFAHTTMKEGPFHYVFGSHRNTEGKLRWLYDRTRELRSHAALVNITRGGTGRLNHGPYRDETHPFQGSLRFLDFDPARPIETTSAADLQRYGFRQPTPVVTPPGGLTLVIADTSGLHYRGLPKGGAHARSASRLNSLGGGCGYCIPRKNPFYCALRESAC